MKNLKTMSLKKLQALRETASDEEILAIDAEIATRKNGQVEADETPEAPEASAEQAKTGETSETPEASEKVLKNKLTAEEKEALIEQLKATVVNHRCQVVPFNTIDWVDGTVVGVIDEKRANRVMLAVKTDDGRRIIKAHDSKLIKISDEVQEPQKKVRTPKEIDHTPWADEDIKNGLDELQQNVGKTVTFEEGSGAFGRTVEGEEKKTVVGRIFGIVPEKRCKRFMYRIRVIDENDQVRIVHKVVSGKDLVIAEDFDEEGQEINTAYVNRRLGIKVDKKFDKDLNEKEAFELAAQKLEKAKAAQEKAAQMVTYWQETLEASKEAYEKAIAEGKTFDEPKSEETPTDDELL